jgi:subtilisin family serine protease
LAEGMQKVSEKISQLGAGRQLVVNCSWMLDLPLCDEHCASTSDEGVEYEFEEAVRTFVDDERDQAYLLRATCNSIFLAGGQVFAAAGNDWSWAKKKKELAAEKAGKATPSADEPRPDAPEARYPAAFVSVVGVGAIPRGTRHTSTKYKASSYSNLGDKPAGIGIVTLGGEEGAKKGVLGLYLEDQYPVEIPNPDLSEKYKRVFEMRVRNEKKDEKNAWAWWAGTSFATPILTGTVAAVLSAPGFAGDPQAAVQALYSEGIIQDHRTDADEDVMHVSQGA